MKKYIFTLCLLILLPSFAAEHDVAMAFLYIAENETAKLVNMIDSGRVNLDDLYTLPGKDEECSLLCGALAIASKTGEIDLFKTLLAKSDLDLSKIAAKDGKESCSIEDFVYANSAHWQEKGDAAHASTILSIINDEKSKRSGKNP